MSVRKQNFMNSLAARARRMRELTKKPKPAQLEAASDFYQSAKETPAAGKVVSTLKKHESEKQSPPETV
jgi:hypothetical protein